jgi:hypothetical protein
MEQQLDAEEQTEEEREEQEKFEKLFYRSGPLWARLQDAVDELMEALDGEDEEQIEAAGREAERANTAFMSQSDEVGLHEEWRSPPHLFRMDQPVPRNSEINPSVSLSTPPPKFDSYDPFVDPPREEQ